jgi:hypothetical protein
MYGRENPEGMLGGVNPLALALGQELSAQAEVPRVSHRQHRPPLTARALPPNLELVPEIRCVSSLLVPLDGAVVRLSGVGLDPNLRLYIGEDEADLVDFAFEPMPATAAADAQPLANLSFVAPVKRTPGFYTLRVVNPDGASAQLPGSFCYDEYTSAQLGLAAAQNVEADKQTHSPAHARDTGPPPPAGPRSNSPAQSTNGRCRPSARRLSKDSHRDRSRDRGVLNRGGEASDRADGDLVVPPPSHLLGDVARTRRKQLGPRDDELDELDDLTPPPAFFSGAASVSRPAPAASSANRPVPSDPPFPGATKTRQRRKWG